ncbi:MAG: hypothetical protein ACP5G2_00915 [Candidatus Bipolaricaulaceae bacterium]
MSNSFWRPSAEQRRTILLLEALGLIHDLGKLSDTFLQSQAPSSTQRYNHNLLADPRQMAMYKQYTTVSGSQATNQVYGWLNEAATTPCAFGERVDLTTVLARIQFTDWTNQTYSFAELMPLVAKPSLAWGQNAISSSDWQQVLGKEMQPGLLVGVLHGVAHIEKEGDPQLHKQPYSDVFRASPFGREEEIKTGTTKELTDALRALPLADMEQIASDQRRKWLAKMRTEMRRGLADNRRPHNEVSLWDWGYTVATLTKAAATYIYKNGWPANLADVPFRTLRINLNRLEHYTRSDKISDLLGVRQAIDDAFDRVQKLLEETYALGNCFYHDETGAYYLFPDLYSDEEMAALRQEIQDRFPPDLRPQVHLGKWVTAGRLDRNKKLAGRLVAEPRLQTLHESPVRADNNLYLFKTEWSEGRPENAEICTVCGVRPVGYPRQGSAPVIEQDLARWATQQKAEQRNICRVCLDRRGRRAKEWAENGLQGTIWTDEVADDNGRLALLVGKLGLEGWLDGTLLDTIKVTSNATKTPSPARLYRIAETARAFWKGVSDRLTPDVIGQRPFRLALYPDHPLDLGDFHAYELEIDGIALSVVWDKPNGRVLTAENLGYFVQRWQKSLDELPGRLRGHAFDILEPSEYGRPGQSLLRVEIERVETLDGYHPDIPLLAEPSVCMILIPASTALALARAVKREYEAQMRRVRDRLPLHLGLVFCQRRTPIRAVLEAGRSMLEMAGPFDMNTGGGWEGWRLVAKSSPSPGECELVFDNGITWRVPILAGDGSTKDDWYPRLYEGNTWHGKQTKHVSDLRVRGPRIPQDKGWKVWVRPSRFDFEFLDTTARRFEIYYDGNGRRPRRTRPFYLEDLDRLEELWKYMKRLTQTRRHQVIRTIEATREAWYGPDDGGHSTTDEVFRRFVADTLARATWPKDQSWGSIPQEWREKLVQAGVFGELTDLAELHMEILKE